MQAHSWSFSNQQCLPQCVLLPSVAKHASAAKPPIKTQSTIWPICCRHYFILRSGGPAEGIPCASQRWQGPQQCPLLPFAAEQAREASPPPSGTSSDLPPAQQEATSASLLVKWSLNEIEPEQIRQVPTALIFCIHQQYCPSLDKPNMLRVGLVNTDCTPHLSRTSLLLQASLYIRQQGTSVFMRILPAA